MLGCIALKESSKEFQNGLNTVPTLRSKKLLTSQLLFCGFYTLRFSNRCTNFSIRNAIRDKGYIMDKA